MGRLQKFRDTSVPVQQPPAFEMAGPRQQIFFDPSKLKCGIVTCGGLCPGLNDVIRSIVLGLFHHYGVRTVFGFPYGYEGLNEQIRYMTLLNSPPTSLPTFRKKVAQFSDLPAGRRMLGRWSTPSNA